MAGGGEGLPGVFDDVFYFCAVEFRHGIGDLLGGWPDPEGSDYLFHFDDGQFEPLQVDG